METETAISLVTSISLAIIALGALVVSVWTLYANRRHNRLSVRPKLVGDIHQSAELLSRELKNGGLGPAEITSVEVFIDGKLCPDKTLNDAVRDVLGEGHVCDVMNIAEGYSLLSNQTLKLFVMKKPLQKKEFVVQMLNRVDIRIAYKSLYGESFVYNSSD